MKKRSKAILILFLMIGILITPLKVANAHSIELDPESLISMPFIISGGTGTVTIRSSVTEYTLFFQAVKIASTTYSEIEENITTGENELNTLEEAIKVIKTEVDNLEKIYDSANTAYTEGLKNTELTEPELEELKNDYETAKTNYENKVTEYNNKIDEYDSKVIEINSKTKELTPTYEESDWIQTTDNKISVDVTQFSGEEPYVVWTKLVTSGETYYDEAIYTITGSKDTQTEGTNTSVGQANNTISTDATTATGILPRTGISSIVLMLVVGIIVLAIIFYKKYKYLNIK